jgi:hypothetical protein
MSTHKKNSVGRPRVASGWSSVRKSTFSVDFDKTPAAHTFIESYGAQAAVAAFDQYLVQSNHAVCSRLGQKALPASAVYSQPIIQQAVIGAPSPSDVFEPPIFQAQAPEIYSQPAAQAAIKRGSILDDEE